MKTIDSIKELTDLEPDLLKFILGSCPWIAEGWDPESTGFVFLLDDNDSHKICTVPHIPDYRDSMTIDLATFVKAKGSSPLLTLLDFLQGQHISNISFLRLMTQQTW